MNLDSNPYTPVQSREIFAGVIPAWFRIAYQIKLDWFDKHGHFLPAGKLRGAR